MTIPAKHFYMIRHGQTEANAAKIMAGHLDSPLTPQGIEEARLAAQILPFLEIKPKAIFHSHLSRARDTAGILNEALDVPMFEDPDLAEMHAGEWEGVPFEQCKDMLYTWPDPPGGETYIQFLTRVKRAKMKALSHTEGPVMVVCHGGVFRAFSQIHGIETYGVRNCHLYEFEPAPENAGYPWKTWHYEHYDGETPALQCDCTVEDWTPLTKPSSVNPPGHVTSYRVSDRVMRTACDIFHPDNISVEAFSDSVADDSPADKIAS